MHATFSLYSAVEGAEVREVRSSRLSKASEHPNLVPAYTEGQVRYEIPKAKRCGTIPRYDTQARVRYDTAVRAREHYLDVGRGEGACALE